MSESTTTTEDYKKLNKVINSYKKTKRINEQQKELRKNPQNSNSQTSKEIEATESKVKKKVETYTQKAKDLPKSFKQNSENQLRKLVQTYITSKENNDVDGKNINNETEKIKELKQKEAQFQKELTNAVVTNNVPEQKRLNGLLEKTKKDIRRAELNVFKTDTKKDAIAALRNSLIQAVTRTKDEIKDILKNEYVSALGCSQEQNYQDKEIYIKVSNIDIFGKTLQTNPNGVPGKYVYEFKPFTASSIPRSFNRELWNRIQKEGQTYEDEYSTPYVGVSGQDLFDIEFIKDPTPTLTGEFFKVTLKKRIGGNTVAEFLLDYLNTIDVLNFNELFSNVLNLLIGSINMKNLIGYDDLRNQTVFEKLIQRVLGLCFDNKQEIDVTGTGKLDSSDQIDDSFFELTEEDLLEIENKIKNIQENVVQYKDCGALSLPVNVDGSLSLIDEFLVEDMTAQDADKAAQNMLDSLGSNPDWLVEYPQFNFSNIINEEFINLLPIAVLNSVLSPKHLFPLFVMAKALQKDYVDGIDTTEDFFKEFRKMVINITSKIQAIFVKQLFIAIKQNLKSLMASIVRQTADEILTNKQKLILAGVNLALTTLATIQDFRRCKNVVDELLNIVSLSLALKNALRGTSSDVPTIINYIAAATKPGMSPTSILTKFIEKMEEQGVPTGDMPSGKPNIGLLMTKSLNEAIIDEMTQNGYAQTTVTAKEIGIISQTGFVKIKGNVL
jgi:hypothetical protein